MSEQNATKIVIDTNIWISFCIGSNLEFLIDKIVSKEISIFFSNEQIEELFAVLDRPKIIKFIKTDKLRSLHCLLSKRIQVISPEQRFNTCRDPKDNFLLDLAVSAQADYLITGDKDLLVLDPFHSIRIVSVSEFEKLHKKQ